MGQRGLSGLIQRSLRSLLAPAENPRATPDNPLRRQRLLREQVRSAMADLQATIDRIETDRAVAQTGISELETSARRAITARQEEVARIALRRQQLVIASVSQLDRQHGAISAELHRLSLLDQQIGTRLDDIANRERLAELRRAAAQVQVDVGEALTGFEPQSGPDSISGLERDAESLEARAAAIEELLAAGVLGGSAWPATVDQDVEQEVERRIATLRDEVWSEQGARSSDKC